MLPLWAHLKQLAIYLHSSILIVCHYHSLTRKFVLAILLVVLHYVGTQAGYGVRVT